MWPFRKRSSTDLGVLGEQLAQLQTAFEALSEDYSAFKETQTAFRKRVGMRWARNQGNGAEDPLTEQLRALLAKRSSSSDFPEM